MCSEGVLMVTHPESLNKHAFLFGTSGVTGVAGETHTHTHVFLPPEASECNHDGGQSGDEDF